MSEPLLVLDRVTRRLGPDFAVRQLGLEVAAGSCLALVGPSGAGKTTVLRLVAGLELPDAGTVRIGGEAVSGAGRPVPPHRRGVGLVFQGGALWPHVSVADHAYHGTDPGLPRAERRRRAHEVLERLELGDKVGRRPHELSGGERQRVALARALASRPQLLLLDEPLASLDLGLRRSLLARLRALKDDDGATLVYVSHEPMGLAALADRVAVMDGGAVVEEGAAAEVLRDPASDAGRRLLDPDWL